MNEPPVFSFDEVVTTAIKMLITLGFSPGEQVQVLGGTGPFAGTQDDVHDYIVRTNHRTVFRRCEIIFSIAIVLTELFEGKQQELWRWMRVRHPSFDGESMHSLMTSGKPSDMDRALQLAHDAARS